MFKKKSSIYFTIFTYLTLSIVGTLGITSIILYINFENISLQQVYKNDMDALQQAGKGVGVMTNLAMTVSNQIYNDLNVASLRYYASPDNDALRIADEQLTNYRLSLPFIDSVYIYNGVSDIFYINATISRNVTRETIQAAENFDDPFVADIIKNGPDYKPYVPVPRVYTIEGPEKIVKNYYTYIIYDSYLKGDISDAVIVNISESWFSDFINAQDLPFQSESFIINNRGMTVSESESYPMMSDLSGTGFISEILKKTKPGTVVKWINGAKRLISYTSEEELGFRYIKITPWDLVFSKIENMKKLTIILSFILLSAGFLLSLFSSRKLFKPINKIFLERVKNTKLLKTVFLRDILLGRGAYDEQIIQQKLTELGIGLDWAGYYRLILVKIDRYQHFSRDYGSLERGIFKTEIEKRCKDFLAGGSVIETLEMGNDGMAVLLNSNIKSLDFTPQVIRERLRSLQQSVQDTMGITISAAVSPVVKGLANLAQPYASTIEASFRKLFLGHNCIIFAEEIADNTQVPYEYPIHTEKALINALMSGKIDEARKRYDSIISETVNYPVNVFNLALSRLAFSVDDAVKTIKRNNVIRFNLESGISASTLAKLETIEDINNQFYTIFLEIKSILSDKRTSRNDALIAGIDEYISSNYDDPYMYIESIAEHMAKSATYISHLYKQYTSKTILDRIIDVRMVKARDLLTGTRLPVSEIAAQCGFANSSYFFKVFKKVNGATPISYRKNYQKIVKG